MSNCNGSPFVRRVVIPRIDNNSIPVLESTGYSEDTTVNFGINPCIWKALPNQVIVLWKVRHPVTTTGAALPATVVIPATNVSSTVVSDNTLIGTQKLPIFDNKSTSVVGSDVTNVNIPTEHIVYINKCCGIFRLLGVTAAAAPAQASVEVAKLSK